MTVAQPRTRCGCSRRGMASELRQILQNLIDPVHHQFWVRQPTPHRRRCQAMIVA
jgi:hypothetical protein